MTPAFTTPTFEFEFLRTLSHVRYGGADVGECFAAARRIDDGDDESWYDEWRATADRVAARARESHARGHLVSARDAWLRASNYYRTADFFLHGRLPDARVDHARQAAVDCYRAALPLLDPPGERIEIPYEGGAALPGYFYPAADLGSPRPLVVIHNGFDGTGDECYFMGGRAAQERGYHVLAFEGPGQGEVLHRQGLVFRPDWENVVSVVLDHALTRPYVDPDRIALIGISMGALLAARAAAFDDRIKAVIAFDGVYDMFDFSLDHLPMSRQDAARRLLADEDEELDAVLDALCAKDPLLRWSVEHGRWAFGAPTARSFLAAFRDYHLRDGIAERIACPVLVMKSEHDFAFQGQPERLYEHLRGPRTLIEFTDEEGAGAHCQVGAMTLACAQMYDWLGDVFGGRLR